MLRWLKDLDDRIWQRVASWARGPCGIEGRHLWQSLEPADRYTLQRMLWQRRVPGDPRNALVLTDLAEQARRQAVRNAWLTPLLLIWFALNDATSDASIWVWVGGTVAYVGANLRSAASFARYRDRTAQLAAALVNRR